jgi:hypothetical protein
MSSDLLWEGFVSPIFCRGFADVIQFWQMSFILQMSSDLLWEGFVSPIFCRGFADVIQFWSLVGGLCKPDFL